MRKRFTFNLKKYCHTSNGEQDKDIFYINLRGKCLMKLKLQLFFQHGLNWLNIFWKHPLEKNTLSNKNCTHSGKRFIFMVLQRGFRQYRKSGINSKCKCISI